MSRSSSPGALRTAPHASRPTPPPSRSSPSEWEAAQREGLTYERRWKPAPDAVSLRVVVRDVITGKYGTLDVPLQKLAPPQK